MSKRQVKAQASSSRAASSAFGSGFGAASAIAFGASSSPLSYVSEPPDLSAISDPNVVVAFKNLSKKDSTTKAKALEDLQTYISSVGGQVEDGILEAWIKTFPRTSIDSSRRVRQLAQSLQGQICAAAGKRIAKYIPKAVGAWLCGLYDNDRLVVKATQESLKLVFSTPEKLQNLRKAYQQPILEYCRYAIDNETALTLSDERTVSPDDAEGKYCRVIAACIAVIGSLLTDLKPEDSTKYQSDYDAFLGDQKLWEFATYEDASVRRSTHRFLRTCLLKKKDSLSSHLRTLSKSYLYQGLSSNQTGSAYEYVETVVMLTELFPLVWTDHYSGKKTVTQKFQHFLKRGSQSGPREFWDGIAKLFNFLPKSVLPATGVDAVDLLGAMHSGIIKKDEPRANLAAAFGAYLHVALLICSLLPEDDQRRLMSEMVLPIFSQYLRPSPEQSQWAIPEPNGSRIISKVMVSGIIPSVLQEEWPKYAEMLIEDIKTSAPEQSKDFEKSHKALIQQAARLASLQAHALDNDSSGFYRPVLSSATALIVSVSLEVLISRKGKPYGAAGVVAEFLRLCESLVFDEEHCKDQLMSFLHNDLPSLFISPSYSWRATLKAVLGSPDSPAKLEALGHLLTSPKIPTGFNLASSDAELQNYINAKAHSALQGTSDWLFFGQLLQSPSTAIATETADEILSSMTKSLSVADSTANALEGFQKVTNLNPLLLKHFVPTPEGSELLRSLLLLAESADDQIAQEASAVNNSIHSILTRGSDGGNSKQSMFDVIQNGLKEASRTSVSVNTLVELATKIWVAEEDSTSPLGDVADCLLPDGNAWTAALTPFLAVQPRASLSITNVLGGTSYLVPPSSSQEAFSKTYPRDGDGFSAAFRIASYASRVLCGTDVFEYIATERQEEIYRLTALTVQLIEDNLGLAGSNNLWAQYTPEVENVVVLSLEDARNFMNKQLTDNGSSWDDDNEGPTSFLKSALVSLHAASEETSSSSYYSSRALSVLTTELIEIYGWNSQRTPNLQTALKGLRRSKSPFYPAAFLTGYSLPLSTTKSSTRLCNEYVAEITGLDIAEKSEEGLRQLVMLNLILYNHEDVSEGIARQRAIFFVKHVIPWLEDDSISLSIRAEVCRSLSALLPLISDIYGSHWGKILNCLADQWSLPRKIDDHGSNTDATIPSIHASLKLYATLRSLKGSEDPNDDLVDAWKDSEENVASGLINLLKHSQHFPDEYHQPLRIVNELLTRQISKISLQHLNETEELFPLLYVESQSVQQAAFDILHQKIPAAQEQISIDAAIDKSTARLPEELLSLILEAPTLESLADASFERSMPLPLRGYLLSWLLVFDHMQHASYKVKTDYIEHIKEGDYLPGLLDFTFDFLGHARGKPVDVGKLDVTTYTPDMEPPERDSQWLLTHIYYLCLTHMPSLAKTWWIDCKSRQKVIAVESWTEKFISPHVITTALAAVSAWSATQPADDEPLLIRVSPRAREVTAAYEVDEQTMRIRLAMPPTYPLHLALVEGLSRVAVDEKKWQSWLLSAQGVIASSNGNLIDGLTAWRRNVVGTLKGQSECAICYSIIGADKQLPSKRCSTCKNLFHASCLYKWFKTSNASSCPLCRNAFNYG
ncbi:uncharacterized protein BDZ99DRAFT_420629 [Mytilinidion resinicola]|uniref:E3 ubiquitin-protein ligase listerin n=1 Tax=Mytilinidion resinicola TaxID=574789 RepID=A0A6A6YGM4_9PEZI|nr:uncharacterized protein BDZ99DRAFT_420629 [Mytilinidion resinicola]KAF2807951.1 hypothetical protein BDZ99DRAFT_420629 [Mytilinidion resinicola]